MPSTDTPPKRKGILKALFSPGGLGKSSSSGKPEEKHAEGAEERSSTPTSGGGKGKGELPVSSSAQSKGVEEDGREEGPREAGDEADDGGPGALPRSGTRDARDELDDELSAPGTSLAKRAARSAKGKRHATRSGKIVVKIHEARGLVSRTQADAEKERSTKEPFVVVKIGKWIKKGKIIRKPPNDLNFSFEDQVRARCRFAISRNADRHPPIDLTPRPRCRRRQTFTGKMDTFGRRATSVRILVFDRDNKDVFVRTARGANSVLSGNTIYLPGILHGKGHHFVGRAAVLLSSIPGFHDNAVPFTHKDYFADTAAVAVASHHLTFTEGDPMPAEDEGGDPNPFDDADDDDDAFEGPEEELEEEDERAAAHAAAPQQVAFADDAEAAVGEADGLQDPAALLQREAYVDTDRLGLMQWLTLYSKSGRPVGSIRISIRVLGDEEGEEAEGAAEGAEACGAGAETGNVDDAEVEQYAASLALPKEHWEEADAAGTNVRGANYLADKKKVPSERSLLRLEAVEIVGVDDVDTRVTRTPGRGAPDAIRRAGADEVSMDSTYVVLHFVVPADKSSSFSAYSLAMYYSYRRGAAAAATNAARLLERWLHDDDVQLANSRMKLVPRIIKGPWHIKSLIGAPCMLGKYSKLSFERATAPDCHEVVIDCVRSEKLRSKFTQIVKNIGDMVVDLAFVLQGEQPAELPEQIFSSVRLKSLDLSALPVWSTAGGAALPSRTTSLVSPSAATAAAAGSAAPTSRVPAPLATVRRLSGRLAAPGGGARAAGWLLRALVLLLLLWQAWAVFGMQRSMAAMRERIDRLERASPATCPPRESLYL